MERNDKNDKADFLDALASRGEQITQDMTRAEQRLAQEQEALATLEQTRASMGYPTSGVGPGGHLSAAAKQRVEQWRQLVAQIAQQKERVREATAALQSSKNDAAAWAQSLPERKREMERVERREQDAALHSRLEQEAFREEYTRSYIQAGGTPEGAAATVEGAWKRELSRRAAAGMNAQREELRRTGRYEF